MCSRADGADGIFVGEAGASGIVAGGVAADEYEAASDFHGI